MNINIIIVGVIGTIVVLGGGFVLFQNQTSRQTQSQYEPVVTEKKEAEAPTKIEGYSSQVLAGKTSLLLDFTKADYEKALQSEKIVLFYFYANWCPICRVEVPNELYPAFNILTTDKVIGFRVNYNDSDTDEDEKALAKQFGITYQHSKVILKDGKEVVKSLDQWDKAQYLKEINAVVQ